MNRILNGFIFFTSILIILSTKGFGQVMPTDFNANKLVVDSLMPEIKGFTIDSVEINKDYFQNKVTIIQFSRIGCKSCVIEYEYLNELFEIYGINDDFSIVGIYPYNKYGLEEYINKITPEKPSDPLKLTYAKNAVPEYQLFPESPDKEQKMNRCSRFSQKFGIYGYPVTLIIDKKGILRYKRTGFPHDSKMAIDLVYEWKELINKYKDE
nr:hypothetical protein [uncultured Carboxylicivirga sp.]